MCPKLSDAPFSKKVDWQRSRWGSIDVCIQKMKPIGFADLTPSSALDIAAHSSPQCCINNIEKGS